MAAARAVPARITASAAAMMKDTDTFLTTWVLSCFVMFMTSSFSLPEA